MDIRLLNVTKSFEDKVVLKDVNIMIPEGRRICLMGASGAGKTTLLNLIMGLTEPDSGEILGREGIRIAAVFQEDRLIEHWDAVRNIKLVCDKSISTDEIKAELHKVGLDDVQGKPVSRLSGGQRRRVSLIRAMLAKSSLLIMDEPLKGLDSGLKVQVIEYIKQNTKNKTILIVTHDMEEAQLLEADIRQLADYSIS